MGVKGGCKERADWADVNFNIIIGIRDGECYVFALGL